MHARTEVTTVKLIGPRCAIYFIEEYSRRHNYNRTFDLWIWTNDPDAIPKMAWLGLCFKQPLTPRSLKMIADLVKKGGCKKLKLKATKGKAAVAPA
ncbi:hypothetical protein OsJ_28427 [Oryza sativa Japonica Group]|uniref:Uncharacterized protein n=1 Tax=Oryza sativa subsp. japonica TaxID=39947 RepID=B9G267_ORYSJ|nr:hypothetical protein OsJ_28427 [Oryza sativa Japonica Group]